MTATAYMRVLGGLHPNDNVPLEVDDRYPQMSLWSCDVPGFGTVMVETDPTHAKYGKALIVHPDRSISERDVTVVDGRFEVEMLHKADRLCVVFEP